jgi:tetratricopeptide (TPR) repeat protein
MWNRTAIAVTSLGVALFVACMPDEQRAEDARDALKQALERVDRGAALVAIDELQETLPNSPESLLEIAQLRVAAGDAPRASWLLEEAVRRFPKRDDLRLALARVALLLGNPSLAHEALAPIAPDSERHADALVTRARAQLNLGDLERALETLAEAERLYPDRPEARLVRIATLLSEQRREEALVAIEEARAVLVGDDEEQRYRRRRLEVVLAQIQAQQGEPDAAIETLKQIIATEPGDVLAWQALLQIHAQQQRGEEGLALLEGVLGTDAPPINLYPLAAQLHIALGDPAAAEWALRSHVAQADSAAAYLPLVNFHSNRDDAAATAAVLEEAIARFPNEPALRMLYTETLLAQQRIDDARAEYQRFRESTFDRDPQIDYLRARIALASGNAGLAVAHLTELAPRLDRAATQFWLGRALEQTGDTNGARRRYGLARQRDRHWTAPTMALIALEQRRGAWRALAGQARTLVRRAPQRMEGWTALVTALENLGEGKAAEQAANRCIERFPDAAEPQFLLARALRAQGHYDEALEALDAAEKAGNSATTLAAERIFTLGMGDRVEEGTALASEALARDPDAAVLHAAHAALLFAAGAAEPGALATDRALALDPGEPRPLRVRCEFRASIHQWPAASDDCTRYLAARPDDAGAYFMLGVIEQWRGDRQTAITAYRRAAALDEHDARPLNNLAGLLATDGDLDGALAAAQEAYRLDETNPHVMDTLGALYLRKGLVDRAISLLKEAQAAAPDLPDATLHLALAYRDTGRTGEARVLLTSLQHSAADHEAIQLQVEEALDSLP